MLDGALVARVDLKAVRQEGRLVVRQASLEPGAGESVVEALRAELERMAGWLGLGAVDSAVLGVSR